MQLKPFEVSEFYISEQRELKDTKGRGQTTLDQGEEKAELQTGRL